jgi:parallel beta-helix repeat protein
MYKSIRLNGWVSGGLIFVLIASALFTPWGGAGLPSWQAARASSTTLVISEVLYDPYGSEPDGEWIELYNLSRSTIDLSSYKLGDEPVQGGSEGMMSFPSGASAGPGQILIVANKASAFYATYGFYPDYELLASLPGVPDMLQSNWSQGNVALSNEGDEVLLLDGSNTMVDGLSYGNSYAIFNPPAANVAEGHSLERSPVNVDGDTNADWIDQGTPQPGKVYLSQIEVYSTSDSGIGSLRQALLEAGEGTTITFDPSVFPPDSPATISVLSALPEMAHDNLTIDASDAGVILAGTSAPDYTNGLAISGSSCVVRGLLILGFGGHGIVIKSGASNNIIGGDRTLGQGNLISGNVYNGIDVYGPSTNGNQILGNYLGVDPTGTYSWANGWSGIAITQGASDTVIGNGYPNQGNLISGNSTLGIYISDVGSIGTAILGNLIGLNQAGTGALGNAQHGILITNGAQNTSIGDGTAGGRNIISGNQWDGVCIEGPETTNNTVQGNYMGTDINGAHAVPNVGHAVELTDETHNNLVGGDRLAGKGNVLSGNVNHGLLMSSGAHHNSALGNLIGTDATGMYSLGNQLWGGVDIRGGASTNTIGGTGEGEGNVISGNGVDGIAIFEGGTNDNIIIGNLIGLAVDGVTPLPNKGDGLFHFQDAAGTIIQDNIASGNRENGMRIIDSPNLTIEGNRLGTDRTGTLAVPNKEYGLRLSGYSNDGTLSGNTISGNRLGGMWIDQDQGYVPNANIIQDNDIGVDSSGVAPLGNGGPGITVQKASNHTIGPDNTIAYNLGVGVQIDDCNGNTITQNAIYSNTLGGIQSSCLAAPQLVTFTLTGTETVSGLTAPSAWVEFFSTSGEQGQSYEGKVKADTSGDFTFSKAGGFAGPNLTAIATDSNGNSSGFSLPAHLSWTILLYLNGDNDLEEVMLDIVDNLAGAGPSPYTNILALVDGYTDTITHSETALYDLTYGITTPLTSGVPLSLTGELDMGDGQTLVDFVKWGKSYYPAHYTLLSIVDHGGGWAPDDEQIIPGASIKRPRHERAYLAGLNGLSWDFSAGYDYLNNNEIAKALDEITQGGADPLDIVFYDTCSMGMLENAYQIRAYASYFVSSQNIAWAPLGPGSRYVRLMLDLPPEATPRQAAEFLVQAYTDGTPPLGHPFTISAVDLSAMPATAEAVDELASAISQTLTDGGQAALLYMAYWQSQKMDYDSDFNLEPTQDGYVDLYDLALHIQDFYEDPAVLNAAQDLLDALDSAIVAEEHRSGSPWIFPELTWDLDNAHGLSIYFPLGEELLLPVEQASPLEAPEGLSTTVNIPLRTAYTSNQLQFVADTHWKGLIDTYYQVAGTGIPTDTTSGPAAGLQPTDFAAPHTVVTVTQELDDGIPVITLNWESTDSGSGVDHVTIWYRAQDGTWEELTTKTGSSGSYELKLFGVCDVALAVTGTDRAGNQEAFQEGVNMLELLPCKKMYLPVCIR